MKGYVARALKEYQQPPPQKPDNGTTPYTATTYGKSVQYAPIEEEIKLTDKKIRHVQEVCGNTSTQKELSTTK